MSDAPSPGKSPSSGDARWRRVNELFHLALERDEAARGAFIEEAAGGDDSLRDEVRALIAAHSRAGDFLEGVAAGAPGPPATDPLPSTIGQYRIESVIGRGGMGLVYLAEDTRLGRRVALKAISPDYTHDPSRRDRLRREARAAAGLTHPGIATVYALEEFDEDLFIAVEYVPGETLREEINRGPAAPGRALETGVALAGALAAAHDRGVIHRDLKPENVMRTGSGGIKILDFGLAQMTVEPPDTVRLTAHGRVIGTPAYMAPEQIRQTSCDGRTDLFAFGIVMYELITGAHPFEGTDAASTIARILEAEPAAFLAAPPSETVPPPATVADHADRRIADALFQVVRRCLAKSPDARFSSAHALLAALETVRQSSGKSAVSADRAPDRAMRWWEFHQGAACISYILLMLPMWLARDIIGGRPGLWIFVGGLVATVAASVLRLHLWFAASSLPDEWRAQRKQSHPWLRSSEVALVAALAAAGLGVLEDQAALGATLVSAAVAVLLSFSVIEPATTRAAFKGL